MNKLSVVVSAYNAQEKIEDCLKSARFADEIIVVNNSSTDKTEELAKKYTPKIFTKPNNLMLNVNKNFGFSKATGDWILCLDDDERITPELEREIREALENKTSNIDGYFIPRKNIIFGKWIEHSGWYPDLQMRLFRKGKGEFEEKHVHEMIKINGQTGSLKQPMLHYNYQNISQFLYKMGSIYAPNEAEVLISQGYKLNFSDAINFPLKEFLSRFFAQKGYKDGFHGLMLSLLMAFYHFCVFAFVWEKQGFAQIEQGNILDKSAKELTAAGGQIKYWLRNEKIENMKSPVSKTLYKIVSRK